jgi:hypothetical protein
VWTVLVMTVPALPTRLKQGQRGDWQWCGDGIDVRQHRHGSDEPEAAAGHRLDVVAACGLAAQRTPQAGHGLAEVVLFDHQARPQRAHQRVLFEQSVSVFDEQRQGTEQSRRQAQLAAVAAQHALLRTLQHAVPEGIAIRHDHGADSDFFQKMYISGQRQLAGSGLLCRVGLQGATGSSPL